MKKPKPDIASFSYTPYSNSSEYCYVIGQSEICYPGVRVENNSFPLTIPAGQAAICNCLANGDRPIAMVKGTASDKQLTELWVNKFNLKVLNSLPDNASVFDPRIELSKNINQILRTLCEASVSDESHFPVSALLKTRKGYIPGVNIEFKEWNLGLCAERVALSRALASGIADFEHMHIYAPKSDYISPCGACRQVLFEHMPNQTVTLHHNEHSVSRHLISHLLPHGFISDSLKK